ncbi:MAG TPA: DUF3857 domain-containing protein [Allosphingosinicella sp.]|jgi:tetratricopeptide (TPR) repeat protein
MKKALFAVLLGSAAAAQAGEKVLYEPVPAWVKPAPAIVPGKPGAAGPELLLFDMQQRLEGGDTWVFTDMARRADSPESMSEIGSVQLPWQPAHGDLIVHRVEILRGSERIDVLKNKTAFSVLRREQALEQKMLDGVLTATMQVEGLRVGDVVRIAFSTTSKDPTLKGHVQSMAPLISAPVRIGFGRVRLLWPTASKLAWKALSDGAAPAPVRSGAYQEVTFALPLAKPPEMPGDAPARFQNVPLVEASTFPDWGTVAGVMAPLYATKGLIPAGSPLAAEAARIKAASADPMRRAAMALQLVQDEIRYQLMGMNSGNYVPQTPAETWSLRYGDCKAKTLMLLALLHKVGVEAEPVLASLQLGGLVEKRLPSAAAFDHILVRATANGESLWLDGTGSGTRIGDLKDVPALGHVLPVRAGAALVALTPRAMARPEYAGDLELDFKAGLRLPALFKARFVLRGAAVPLLKAVTAQGDKDAENQMVEGLLGSGAPLKNVALAGHSIRFDAADATATVEVNGVVASGWSRENQRWGHGLDTMANALSFPADRARAAWRAIPVSTGAPSNRSMTVRIRLPNKGEGYSLDGAAALNEQIGAMALTRKAVLADGWATANVGIMESGGEVAAADLAEIRRRAAQINARPLRVLAPAGQGARYAEVEAARRAKALAPLAAVYDARIAADPKSAEAYMERASFRETVLDWPGVMADLNRAIAIEPNVDRLLGRATLRFALGDVKAAAADADEAFALDSASDRALALAATYKAALGDLAGGLALLDGRIDVGDKESAGFMALKATLQGESGDKDGAIATLDSAVARWPGDATLLNNRCWSKGTLNVLLDSAVKDCTKSIELSDSPVAALDSRAMAYFRLNRREEALADIEAALALAPDLAASLFLRGVIRRQAGDGAAGAADIAAATALSPGVVQKYARYGIKP